jgi:hypothetical protein
MKKQEAHFENTNFYSKINLNLKAIGAFLLQLPGPVALAA